MLSGKPRTIESASVVIFAKPSAAAAARTSGVDPASTSYSGIAAANGSMLRGRSAATGNSTFPARWIAAASSESSALAASKMMSNITTRGCACMTESRALAYTARGQSLCAPYTGLSVSTLAVRDQHARKPSEQQRHAEQQGHTERQTDARQQSLSSSSLHMGPLGIAIVEKPPSRGAVAR